jgi:hypothetical protein
VTRYTWRDGYVAPAEIPARIVRPSNPTTPAEIKAPQQTNVAAPTPAEVVLPEPADTLTALKRKSHRAPGEAPRNLPGWFQP